MPVGDPLGPYTILEEIGRGGMATVYRARQQSVERDVAIKVILRGIAGDQAAMQRFQREARLIARLEHPHILPVYDFDGAHNPPYLVMRYLDGGTLKDAMARGPLPHDEIAYLMRQVCSALDYAHRQGIIHRDIKASNILLDREANAFVSDFGIARLAIGEDVRSITSSGAIVGTPDYMSPEQAQALGDIDFRTDIYALGVMLYEMLTGQLPFQAESGLAVLMMHVNQPVPSVLAVKPNLSPDLDAVIQRAMAKDRMERYSSAAALSAELMAALGAKEHTTSTHRRGAAATRLLPRVGRAQSTNTYMAPTEQNKTVVALYANAAEYGEIAAAKQGSEGVYRAMAAFWTAAERRIRDYGGLVFGRTDYEVLALWGAESAREDDAEQAVRAALALQTAMRELGAAFLADNEAPPLNIGIHRGLALIAPRERDGTQSASGGVISLANRLMQSAAGSILVTPEVFGQVLGVFDIQEDIPLKMRGRAETVTTFRVVAAKPRAFRIMLRGVEGVETRMIGREAEFKRLQQAFLIALEDSETQVVTIVSEAGIGKSRLLYEFDKWGELRPEQVRVFSGRATPAMTQRPYALVRDIIAVRFEVLDDDAPAEALGKIEHGVAELIGPNDEVAHFIAHLADVSAPDSPYLKGIFSDAQEMNRRARQSFIRLFTTLAKAEPVIVQIEDIHHADDASLDLLNELVTAHEDLHLLVIGCARPSLYERRPTWGSGQRFHTRIDLKPLSKHDSRDLALDILQKMGTVPRELRDLLVERAEGNPLFMEELVKMLIDDHVIIKERDSQWRVDIGRLGRLNVPSTLSGLLEGRLDTLLYPEKLTLQRASVIGRIFYDAALARIDEADETHLRDLNEVLAKLVERNFIYRRESSAFAGSAEYIFASAMLRDTLYERLLERQRRVFHRGAAEWLIGLERANDYLPLIAEHYEQAGDSTQAAVFWQRAGEHASRRRNYQNAIGFFQRVLDAMPPDADAATRLPALLSISEALTRQGETAEVRQKLDDALRLARKTTNAEHLTQALYLASLNETSYGDYPAALGYLNEALPLARAMANPGMLANVLYGLANTHYRTGNVAEGIAAAKECIALCETTGDEVQHMYALNRLASLSLNDLELAQRYSEQALVMARRIGHREGEQTVLNNLGVYAFRREDWPSVERYFTQALELARDLGNLPGVNTAANNLAEYYMSLGMTEKVPPLLREALLVGRRMAALVVQISSIGSIGMYKLAQGDAAGGLRLLGMLKFHSASSSDILEDLARQLDYARTKLGLSDAAIEAGLEVGRSLDLQSVVTELLREYEN